MLTHISLTMDSFTNNVHYWFKCKTINANKYHFYLIKINEFIDYCRITEVIDIKLQTFAFTVSIIHNMIIQLDKINELFYLISCHSIELNLKWILFEYDLSYFHSIYYEKQNIFQVKNQSVEIDILKYLNIENNNFYTFIQNYFISYQIQINEKILKSKLGYRNDILKKKWYVSIDESPSKYVASVQLFFYEDDESNDNFEIKTNCNNNNAELESDKSTLDDYTQDNKIKIEKKRIEITFFGAFKKYPFEIYNLKFPFILGKWNLLIEQLSFVNIPTNFKIKYITQLSLNIFLGSYTECIISDVEKAYNNIIKLKMKSQEEIVKKFMIATFEEKCEILNSLIILDESSQSLAAVIFEILLHNGTSNHTAHEVFCNLHWSTQKHFERAYQKTTKNIESIKKTNVLNSISYEQKLICSKAPEDAVDKAKEKLMLINSPDVGPKVSQWLEGFFKIPFKIYHHNELFHNFNMIQNSANNVITKINSCNSFYSSVKLQNCENEYDFRTFIENVRPIHKDIVLSNLKQYPIYLNSQDMSGRCINISCFYDTSGNSLNDYSTSSDKSNKYNSISSSYVSFSNSSSKISLSTSNSIFKDINNQVENSLLESHDKLNKKLKTTSKGGYTTERMLYDELESIIEKYDQYCSDKISYLNKIKNILDEACYGHNEAKQQILRIVAQWINGKIQGGVIGIQGPPGNGKTTLAKNGISKCLADVHGNPHPFGMIALGGSSNGSTLVGHNFTYVGSTWGKILEILIEKKCMNPIIYIDEIDKISRTEHGREITGILTHLTDSTQNDSFEDRYFSGIKIDMSKALFIVSFNDESLIDPILKDRMQIIRTKSLTTNDKIEIVNNYLLPNIKKTVGFQDGSICIDKNVCRYIIDKYTYEAGVRKLKEILFDIVREYNLQSIFDNSYNDVFNITEEYADEILIKRPKINIKSTHDIPKIGLVNGLYATSAGIGGLTTIEVFRTYSSSFLNLILTGNQGNIMKESTQVALTVAWNIIPDDIKSNLIENKDKNPFALHIHTPASATPKDGPSAGAAITLGIISQLCQIPIRNDIALTGEIDLNCNVTAIGGLYSKIQGAFKAGVYNVFIPDENKEDLKELNDENKLIDFYNCDTPLKVTVIKNIFELIPHVFVKNDLKFKHSN